MTLYPFSQRFQISQTVKYNSSPTCNLSQYTRLSISGDVRSAECLYHAIQIVHIYACANLFILEITDVSRIPSGYLTE